MTAYIRREHPADFSLWKHLLSPWVATLALLPVLFVTVFPVPDWPYNVAPYMFLGLLVAGFGYMLWLERCKPGALQRGATMMVGNRSDDKGGVDWEDPLTSDRR